MEKMRNVLDHTLEILSGVSFLAMVVLTCWQVFTRYILQNPSPWSEELVAYLFAWASLLGASIITGERGHMNIPIVTDHFTPGIQKLLAIFGELIAFAFSLIILVYGGIKITSLAMGQMTSALGVTVGVFYVVMPLCGILNMIYTVLNIVDISKNGVITAQEEKEA